MFSGAEMRNYAVQAALSSKATIRRGLCPIDEGVDIALWERNGGGEIDYGQPGHHTLSVYVAGGRGVRCLSSRSKSESGQTGVSCVLPANRESRWTNTDYVSMLHLYFSDEAFERLIGAPAAFDSSRTFVRDPAMFGIVASFVLKLDWSDKADFGALEHAILAMMNRLTQYGRNRGPADSRGDLTRNQRDLLLHFVDENLRGHISVSDLARELGMSSRTVSRKVCSSFGLPPYRLVLQRRIDRAVSYIESGKSLADAAVLCGFSSQSHMARHFRNALGVTPGQVQRQ